MNRGDRREAIFADEADRRRFLETLAEACQKTGWQVHAYCLMSNHFHLVVETPQPNLRRGQLMILYYFIDGLGRGGIGSGRGSETAHSISRGDLSRLSGRSLGEDG